MPSLTRRQFSKAALAAPLVVPPSGGLLSALAAAPEPKPRKPNIVYFLIDELGYFELSCMGHKELKTPNVDRMAAEGIRFTQFLAGGCVCAPTRATLMTGKHTGHTSLRTNAGWEPLRAGEETIASMLQKAGYATGGFGKWGCGARGTSGVPEAHGFDIFFGYYDQVHAHTFYPTYLIRNSQEVPLEGNPGSYLEGKTFSQYLIHDEARKFLRANKDRPFFLYLPYTPPHGQYGFPDDDPSLEPYKDKPWPRDAKVYAAMVNLVDRQVGEILAMLKELGLDDDTLVFFSGDNGGFEYFAEKGARPDGLFGPNVDPATGKRVFRGGKGRLYEGGLRVPYIVRWPGKIKPGRVSDHLGSFPDLMPTLAELAGTPCPPDTDGLSILPELLGHALPPEGCLDLREGKGAAEPAKGRPQPQHKYLYWEDGGQIGVREGTWHAVRTRGPKGVWELYDLSTDLAETTDLAAGHPDILARLKSYAEEAHADIQEGEVLDRDTVLKDRYIPLGKPIPDKPWGPPARKK